MCYRLGRETEDCEEGAMTSVNVCVTRGDLARQTPAPGESSAAVGATRRRAPPDRRWPVLGSHQSSGRAEHDVYGAAECRKCRHKRL